MATPSTASVNSTFTEAPASWNVRYRLNGFDCMLTLRGDTGRDLLDRATSALKWLAENGAQASVYTKHSEPDPAIKIENNENMGYCLKHQIQMTRFTKDNRVWYSHKLEDGTWCKGK